MLPQGALRKTSNPHRPRVPLRGIARSHPREETAAPSPGTHRQPHVVSGLSIMATDKLVEAGFIALWGLILDDQGQILLLEFLEPLLPGDGLEGLLATLAREIDANPAHIIPPTRPFDVARAPAPRFNRFSVLLVVSH